jgi:hypothetical protein
LEKQFWLVNDNRPLPNKTWMQFYQIFLSLSFV